MAINIGVPVAGIRAIDCVRPLRFLSLSRTVQQAVLSILGAFNGIQQLVIVLAMVWYLFGVLGVQFFGGRFDTCTDASTYMCFSFAIRFLSVICCLTSINFRRASACVPLP